MNRKTPPVSTAVPMLIEALEPRIAPAGLLNEAKFTSVVVGGSITLDASGGAGDFQGLSTAFGSHAGSYLLYLQAGRAVVFTTDLNGNGRLDPNEITGISLGPDAQGHAPKLLLFTDVHGDIVTNLANTTGPGVLTDSDNNPSNGRDGRVLLDNSIANITLRTITDSDLDATVPGNTVANRLALTHFSIYGDIITGGSFGGLTIDDSGMGALQAKFTTRLNTSVFTGAEITVGGILTGTAASNYNYHFTENSPQVLAGTTTGSSELVSQNVAEGTLLPFRVPTGENGGDISNISAVNADTVFSIGVLATGQGGLGTTTGARGGNISNVTLHGDMGSYEVLAGNGGTGPTGGVGGSIIGFNDLASLTGQAFLHSGDGGRGVLGTGGAGGTVTLATTNIAADLEIVLGNGGDGYTHGGNGAGLPSATITAPDVTLPIGGKILSTWHDLGDVGNTHPINPTDGTPATYSPHAIDFDGDGFGDAVYTSTNPSQVVVVFGDGSGAIDLAKTVILKVPGGGTPVVTVGDFNGDGKPDIAVGSGDANNTGGVEVYLNQIGNAILNPLGGSNYTHNPVGNHPFSAAIQSAVPFLSDLAGTFDQAGAITGLAAGDFNGDGITDIAYTETVQLISTGQVGQIVGMLFGEQATTQNTSLTTVGAHTAATFVNGSLDNGLFNNTTGRPEGTGFFYSNPARTGTATDVQISGFIGSTAPVVLHATSLTNGNVPTVFTNSLPSVPEVVAVAVQNDGNNSQSISVFTATAPDPVTHIPARAGLDGTLSFSLGTVDTNRTADDQNPERSYQNFQVQDFTIADVNQDGRADITSVALQPQNFLTVFTGDALTGGFVPATGTRSDDNQGIFLGDTHPPSIAITSSDPSRTGHFDGVALVNLNSPPSTTIEELRLGSAAPVPDSVAAINSATGTGVFGDTGIGTADPGVDTIDGFYVAVPVFDHLTNAVLANPFPLTGYAILAPDTSSVLYQGAYFLTQIPFPGIGAVTGFKSLTQNGINIYSGNGGNSSNGVGGDAGVIGNGALSIGTELTTTASVQLHYTRSDAYEGESVLIGGRGGDGFAGGGVGGSIQGVSARYNGIGDGISLTSFVAGDGGNGISGDGGAGGQLSSLSIENGPSFLSGSGGIGLHGGKGGDIVGNTVAYDSLNKGVTLLAGSGGQGSLGGGQGGTITKWDSEVNSAGGAILYTAGAGGNSSGGTGGAGGSIISSSLDSGVDRLDGDLQLLSGKGGSGLIGGAGGSITNFLNPSTDANAIPTTLTVIAGGGGTGISGNGGAGGSISGFQSNTIGFEPGLTTATGQFNGLARIIAGDGGASFGGKGGAGGSLISVNATATSTPLVAAGGAGGDGLTAGGDGGSVGTASSTTFLNSAAQGVGKLLIVAGKGGDAYAAQKSDIFLPNDLDTSDLAHAVLAFGGATGTGGTGGSVINVQQPSSIQTSVDVIAGNGGSTPNAGTSTSTTTGVGRGGSISGVLVAGTIGTVTRNTTLGAAANPPIKSYSATYNVTEATTVTTTSVSQFVDFLASSASMGDAFNRPFFLDDSTGNVGMVAGASGTVRGGQAARDGVNGSVSTVSASSILSIVAGSVDRVAPVAQLTGVQVTSPDGVLGADKSPNSPFGPNGVLDYINIAGIDQASLEAGFKLIDGAIFATTIVQTAGRPIVGPRVF